MGLLVNLFAKVWGVQKLWDMLDGYKLYGSGALAILGALVGLGSELAPLLSSHNAAGLLSFITHINSDPSWIALLAGFATVGAAHKADKASS